MNRFLKLNLKYLLCVVDWRAYRLTHPKNVNKCNQEQQKLNVCIFSIYFDSFVYIIFVKQMYFMNFQSNIFVRTPFIMNF